ncbi:Hsp20/alpha crystallin family protein [Halobacteria archaeon AArc-dxtr1]|nr:Hsp20/alpha crystallin family protein [Halobacteria archaeon AArc-dxtr1]
MTQKTPLSRDERFVRRYEYGDDSVLAVDLGAEREDVSAEVLGTTVIVADDDEQYEFELPEAADADAHTFIKNGVLTIELEDTA